MKPILILALLAGLALPSQAQEAPVAEPALTIVEAQSVDLGDFLWLKRPVVVFADSPNDPAFAQQMRLLEEDPDELMLRDVIVITDTDPAARSSVRNKLRPRGFSLVLLDKDGAVKLRKPRPWNVREITHAIDKFPLRRQEMLEQMPSGR